MEKSLENSSLRNSTFNRTFFNPLTMTQQINLFKFCHAQNKTSYNDFFFKTKVKNFSIS